MTIHEFSRTLKAQIDKVASTFGDQDEIDLMSDFAGKNHKSTFEIKVRNLAIAPVSVKHWNQLDSTVKRSKGDHAVTFGGSATDFSQQQFLVLVATYGAGLECPDNAASWDDVKAGKAGGRVVSVPQAWSNLTKYREENRDKSQVIMPLASACKSFVNREESTFGGAVMEIVESFGNLAYAYNIGRGLDKSGSLPKDDQDDQDDQDDGKDPEVSDEERCAAFIRRCRENGKSDADILMMVRDGLKD